MFEGILNLVNVLQSMSKYISLDYKCTSVQERFWNPL